MNRVKFYRRLKDGRVDTKELEVTQLKKELYLALAQRIPTVAQVNRAIVKAGWTRKKLWTVIEERMAA